MNYLHVLAASPLLLLALYALFIQHNRGPRWVVFKLVAIPALPLDIILNYTLFPLLLQYWPTTGEWTFSQTTGRMVNDTTWRGGVFRVVKDVLNWIDPLHNHIP